MSTNSESLSESLAGMDVESVRVSPDDLQTTLERFAVGATVGVADKAWPTPLADFVTWDPTPAELWDATTGVTPAAFAIENYGSIFLPTAPPACELVSLYADRHVAVVAESDIVPDMERAFDRLDENVPDMYRDGIIATGPSATADMGALVKGAHGPSEVRVVVVED